MDSPISRLAVVIPCYNAGYRLEPVVNTALTLVENIILVDDGSTDGFPGKVYQDQKKTGHNLLQLISFDQNKGKGHALLAGFHAALNITGIDWVAVLDADGQHDPVELPQLLDSALTNASDLVIGVRSFGESHVPLRSRLGNRLTATITTMLLGASLPDTQSGYRIHSRRFLEHVLRDVAGGRYDTEMEILVLAVRAGYRISNVPIQTIYETKNRSSHFNAFRDSWLIYRRLIAVSHRLKHTQHNR